MCHKNPNPKEETQDKTLYLHGNHAVSDQEEFLGHAYVTYALTQYDIPRENGPKEETDLAVEDSKRRVDKNHR